MIHLENYSPSRKDIETAIREAVEDGTFTPAGWGPEFTAALVALATTSSPTAAQIEAARQLGLGRL